MGESKNAFYIIIGVVLYIRGRIMYKKGGNQKKGAKFGTFLYFLYIKKTRLYIIRTRLYIICISDKMRNTSSCKGRDIENGGNTFFNSCVLTADLQNYFDGNRPSHFVV